MWKAVGEWSVSLYRSPTVFPWDTVSHWTRIEAGSKWAPITSQSLLPTVLGYRHTFLQGRWRFELRSSCLYSKSSFPKSHLLRLEPKFHAHFCYSNFNVNYSNQGVSLGFPGHIILTILQSPCPSTSPRLALHFYVFLEDSEYFVKKTRHFHFSLGFGSFSLSESAKSRIHGGSLLSVRETLKEKSIIKDEVLHKECLCFTQFCHLRWFMSKL